jgi:3-methyl-2-oxobutanoate hydroxymethyltransferase
MAKMTIRDLLDLKGRRQILMSTACDIYTARAAQMGGMDIVSTAGEDARSSLTPTIEIVRTYAPNVLVAAVLPYPRTLISNEEALRCAVAAIEAGADIVCPSTGPERVEALAKQGIPTHGHIGMVPCKSTWTGGMRPVGRTADEALQIFQDAAAFANAGAVVIQIDWVADRVAAEITKRVPIPVISLGSGSGCDGQFLLSSDILGAHPGPPPRHAKKYRSLLEEAVAAFKEFIDDVNNKAYPAEGNIIKIKDDEFERFMEGLD